MPCVSDYMEATDKEVQLSQVCCLLDELDGKKWEHSWWRGYHPDAYGRHHNGDALVAELCSNLQNIDVSKQSLEMQIWWRDHQIADKARIERELKEQKTQQEKDAAIAKLTDHEKRLLGIK